MVQYRKGRPSPWQVQVRDVRGKVITHSFTRKEDAESFEQGEKRKRQLMHAGLGAPRGETLFLDYAKAWLTKRSKGKQSSFRQDEGRLRNYWLELFGKLPMTLITTAAVKERLDEIHFKLDHTAADRNRHRALLHKLFKDAFLDEKVDLNPVSRIPLLDENRKRRPSGTIFELKDQARYIDAVYKEGAQYGILADIMLWTGARIMAAAAVQWQDIDFDAGTVHLRRIFERASGSLQERTKGSGEGGEEAVPLFPILRDRILAWRSESPFVRPSDIVACQKDGKLIAYETFMGVHARALEATKLPRFTPHALKKAFGTNAKRAGFTRSEIREMFGHSSDQVTDRYDLKDISHLVERGKKLEFGGTGVIRVSQASAKKDGTRRISRRGK